VSSPYFIPTTKLIMIHFPITGHVPHSIPFTLSNYCTCTTLPSFHTFQLLYMYHSPFLSHFPITVHVPLSIPFTLSNYCTCTTLHSFHTFQLLYMCQSPFLSHFPITVHVPLSIPFTLSNYCTCATLIPFTLSTSLGLPFSLSFHYPLHVFFLLPIISLFSTTYYSPKTQLTIYPFPTACRSPKLIISPSSTTKHNIF